MNTEDSEFERIEAEAKRRAMAKEDDDTQTYTSESAEQYLYRCGYEAGAAAEREAIKKALAQPEPWCMKMNGCKIKCEDCPDEPPLPEQEPVAYYHPRSSFYWAKPTSIFAPTVVDVPPMPLYTAPPAAQPAPVPEKKWIYGTPLLDAMTQDYVPTQRTWVGLMDAEISNLWSWSATSEAEKTATTQQHAFAKAIEAKLKEKQNDQ